MVTDCLIFTDKVVENHRKVCRWWRKFDQHAEGGGPLLRVISAPKLIIVESSFSISNAV